MNSLNFLTFEGGGGRVESFTQFLFLKTIEKVIRLCGYFFLSGSSEDMGIFHVSIYLSVIGRYDPPPLKTKLKYVKNVHIFKTNQHSSVHKFGYASFSYN